MSKTKQRILKGLVTSAPGNKTLAVEVTSSKTHPKYHKSYSVKKKYAVHDEKNEHRVGNVVTFIPCRPLSKRKRWRVIN